MPETILLTGATGHVGGALLPRLLARPATRVVVLVRARDAAHLDARRKSLAAGLGAAAERLEAVAGDVSAPGLGLHPADRAALIPELTAILHSAASVRFDMDAETAAAENIEATRSMLALAAEAAERGRLERYDQVSTAYVAGDRVGRVYEHERFVGQGFRNRYEWSKCEAEGLVEEAQARGLPTAIHRPSIIVGDSTTGATESFNVIYWPLRLYLSGWWRLFPGSPHCRVDIVPVDFVAEALDRLQADPGTVGGRFHLAVGDGAPTVEEMVGWIRAATGSGAIRYVEQGNYKRYFRPLLKPLFMTKRGAAIRRGGDAFMPYFVQNPLFDTTEAAAALPGLPPPRVRDYIERVVSFAVARDFGRAPR